MRQSDVTLAVPDHASTVFATLARRFRPRDTERVVEPLLLVTMNPPQPGQVVNVDGLRYRVVRLLRWTGTVARLEIERIADDG